MPDTSPSELIRRLYRERHEALIEPSFANLLQIHDHRPRAALGYKRAGDEALFLERYLDQPVEMLLSKKYGYAVERGSVIEIGNLAAQDPFAMVALWSRAANDLGSECDIAVATLTAPLRAMFRRMGVSFTELASARIDRVNDALAWGTYYELDPMVCAGLIVPGQRAITAFLSRRRRNAA